MRILAAILLCAFLLPSPSLAAGKKIELPDQEWSFEGMFGTYDRASMQRGFQVYKEVCAACHAMYYLKYRNLADLGYTEDEIKAIASQYMITDGPNDMGEMFERPGRPADRFFSPFPNEQAAKAANNGAYPVDLSLIVKARKNGADYVHALLTGYTDPPEGVELLAGQYYNKYFPGHLISMAPPLMDDLIEYADGTEATVDQMSRDLTVFLAWASEPEMEHRKRMGIRVLLFLIILAGLFYASKKKVWANLKG